jgi:hypothetical protein
LILILIISVLMVGVLTVLSQLNTMMFDALRGVAYVKLGWTWSAFIRGLKFCDDTAVDGRLQLARR